MRRIVTLAGIAIIAAIAIAWTRASFERPAMEIRPLVEDTTMYPFELMVRHGRDLPTEDWTDRYSP
jgi:hypothetical protein